MKILVGLGNPGKKFKNSRHNVGFMLVDRLSEKWKLGWKTDKKNATLRALNPPAGGEGVEKIILVKPQTLMNSSGIAVKKIIQFSHSAIQPFSHLYIIHDDLDIPLGQYKIQFGKGPKQHNGLLSIEKELGTKDFWRVRVGVENRTPGYEDTRILGENYVLGRFSKKERKVLDNTIEKVVDNLLVILRRSRRI